MTGHFIDPPYNTRSAFELYDDNLEHTQWLSLMWPRLELLCEMLSDDGSEREAAYQRNLFAPQEPTACRH